MASSTNSTMDFRPGEDPLAALASRLMNRPLSEQVEAIRHDQAARSRAGTPIRAEQYLAAFPTVAESREDALVVIVGEVLLRTEAGDPPTVTEYLSRFPHLASEIALQFEIQAACQPIDTLAFELTESAKAVSSEIISPPPGYELLGLLGHGGMGLVYKAHHMQLNRLVALKFIRDEACHDPAKRVRFLKEAELTARLQHPNVVQVYEVGAVGSRMFLALEFIDGQTLAQRIAGCPMPPMEAARLIETVAAAVHEAHRQRVVHRDLKPANVLLTSTGVPKVSDFGLAKWEEDSGLTHTGTILGTPSYMAPEQASGLSDVTIAADIWSLGAILYECLTGRPPFLGDSPLETLRQVTTQDPVAVRVLQPSVPKDLEVICHACLRKEPTRRYPSAAALASDLRLAQAGLPITARPVGAMERMISWAKQNPGWATAVGVAFTLLFVIAIGGLSGLIYTDQKRREAVTARDEAGNARADAIDKYRQSLVELARAERNSRRVGQRFSTLRAVREAVTMRPGDDLRTEAAAASILPDLELDDGWDGWLDDTAFLVFDDNARRFARLSKTGEVTIGQRVNGGEEVVARFHAEGRPGGRPLYTTLKISPDGETLVIGHSQSSTEGMATGVAIWDLRGNVPRKIMDNSAGLTSAYAVSFRPQQRQVAIAHRDGRVAVYELDQGKLLYEWSLGPVQQLAWHPSEGRIAAAVGTRLILLNTATHPSYLMLPLESGQFLHSIAWHPNGRRLAGGCADRRIREWDTQTGQVHAIFEEQHPSMGVQVHYLGDGTRMLTLDWSGVPRLWETVNGRLLLELAGIQVDQIFPSERTEWIGFGHYEKRIRFMRMAPGREMSLLRTRRGSANSTEEADIIIASAVHPDSRLIAAATLRRLLWYDLVTGEELASVEHPSNGTHLPRFFDPDGSLVTAGSAGTHRWPAKQSGRDKITFGPAQVISRTPTDFLMSATADGRELVYPNRHNVLVLSRDRPTERNIYGPQYDVRSAAISPDGQWVFSGSHWPSQGEPAAVVWNRRSNKSTPLPVSERVTGVFSPDGRHLATYNYATGTHLWEVGTWKDLGTRGKGPFCFRSDGLVMAVAAEPGVVRLVETESGRELIRLTASTATNLQPISFSHDGQRLIVSPLNAMDTFLVWDLVLLRQQLADLQLDWDDPAGAISRFSSELKIPRMIVPEVKQAKPQFLTTAEVITATSAQLLFKPTASLYVQRAAALLDLGVIVRAEQDVNQALALDPKHVDALMMRAQLRARRGKLSEAADDWAKLSEDPRYGSDARLLRAAVFLRTGKVKPDDPVAGRILIPRFHRNAALATQDNYDPVTAFVFLDCITYLDPTDHLAANNLAWLLSTGPSDLRDPERALKLARQAIETIKERKGYRNTYGIALLRMSRLKEAAHELEASLKEYGQDSPIDLYALAICLHKQGNSLRAGEYFGRAEEQRRLKPPETRSTLREYNLFRHEAENQIRSSPQPESTQKKS